jgi:hypothetical protein
LRSWLTSTPPLGSDWERANRVPLDEVGSWLGLGGFQNDSGRPYKAFCPSGSSYHSDGGLQAALRVYPDTNTGYCFLCSWFVTPVKLVAVAKDITEPEALALLLDKFSPGDEPQAATETDALGLSDLRSALVLYHQSLLARQGMSLTEDPTGSSEVLAQALSLLSLVKTQDDAVKWLSVGKQAVAARLATP